MAELREMIRRTLYAAANASGTRYAATTGVLWELGEGAALVATDGKRLARASGTAKAVNKHATPDMPVVPAKAMRLLERNLSEEPVRVAFRKNDVLMQTGRAVIYSRLVEGKFPNYKQVIPAKHNHRASLIAGPILAAVKQAAIMADADGNRVRFQFGKKKLTLRAQGAETGQSRVELLTEFDAGKKPFEISFDSAYLTDML